MKLNFLKSSFLALSLATVLFSCGSDDNTDIIQTPDIPPVDGSAFLDLTLANDNITGEFLANATGVAGGTVPGRVRFTSDQTMRRLYITQTLPGGQPEPFVITADDRTTRRLTKPDGSIDLDGDERGTFDFSFDLLVPDSMANGEIVYNFWATSGRGSFRDPGKRLLVGVGTIIVTIGNGNSSQGLISQESITLRSPLADGSSETFISFFDIDRTFRINEGAEFSTFWDIGYFFGNTLGASIASANNYPDDIVDIVTISNANNNEDDSESITVADLNSVYFRLNNTIDFPSITTLSELNTIIDSSFSVAASDPQRITMLSEGDVIEFLDATGRRGLIEVASIVSGFGSNGQIVLNIIAQPSTPIMDGSNM